MEGNLTWMKNINDKGEFIRKVSSFRKWITGIESPINLSHSTIHEPWDTTPSHRFKHQPQIAFVFCQVLYFIASVTLSADGSSGFKAESGRYHLYVSLACPWAHRTLIVRKLKGLEDVISVDVVDWHLTDKGWHFNKGVRIFLNTFLCSLLALGPSAKSRPCNCRWCHVDAKLINIYEPCKVSAEGASCTTQFHKPR